VRRYIAHVRAPAVWYTRMKTVPTLGVGAYVMPFDAPPPNTLNDVTPPADAMVHAVDPPHPVTTSNSMVVPDGAARSMCG
jgi:hypothetical protein